MESGISPPHDLQVLHVIDEAQNTAFSKEHASELMSKYLRQDCRAMSIGVVPLAHNISLIEKGIFNLAHGVIVFPSGQNDLLVIRDFLGDAYEKAKNQKPQEAIAMFKGEPRYWIRTFNSPESFFAVPSPEFLEKQSKQFLASIALVPEPLPVEVQSTPPVPQQRTDGRDQPDDRDPLAKLTPKHYVVIELCRRFPFLNLKGLIEECAKLPKNDRIASAQTFRKYVEDLISLLFFEKVRLPRKKGRPSVFLWPGPLGEEYYVAKYKTCISAEKPRGSAAHTISIHLVAQKQRELYPDAKVSIGYTELPKNSNVKELDLVVETKDGNLYLTEVDYHARNLSTGRLTEMLSLPNAISLRIVCFPKDLAKKKQLEQLDDRISVQPIRDFVD